MIIGYLYLGLVGAAFLLLGVTAVRYYQGQLSQQKLTGHIGISLVVLSFGITNSLREAVITPPARFAGAVETGSLLLLLSGIYLLYRSWRYSEDTTQTVVSGE